MAKLKVKYIGRIDEGYYRFEVLNTGLHPTPTLDLGVESQISEAAVSDVINPGDVLEVDHPELPGYPQKNER